MNSDRALNLQEHNTEKEASVTAQDVTHFLHQNPDFFLHHPDLLAMLELHLDEGGENTVSLVQRQVGTLREQNRELCQQLETLIDTAQKNADIYARTRTLISDIISQTSLNELLELLQNNITDLYRIDASNLILFAEHFPPQSTCTVIAQDDANAVIGAIIEGREVVSGTLRSSEFEFIFKNAENLRSAAIAPLYIGEIALGVLGLGSNSDTHFQTGSETDLIDFLTYVISISLERLRRAGNLEAHL